jgi:hypothetical protein
MLGLNANQDVSILKLDPIRVLGNEWIDNHNALDEFDRCQRHGGRA